MSISKKITDEMTNAIVEETENNNRVNHVDKIMGLLELKTGFLNLPTKVPVAEDEDGVLYMKIHSDVDLNANSVYERDQTEAENAQIEEFLRILLYEEEEHEQPASPSTIQNIGQQSEDAAGAESQLPPESLNIYAPAASAPTISFGLLSSSSKPITYSQLLEAGKAVLFHLDTLHNLVLSLKDYAVGPRPINPFSSLGTSLKSCWTRSKCWILTMLEFWNRVTDSGLSSSSQDFEDVISHLTGLQEEHPVISQQMSDTEFALKQFSDLLNESSAHLGKVQRLSKVVLAEAVPILLPVQKKIFKPTVKPRDRSTPGTPPREVSQSLGGLPSVRCGIDGFSIWMKWKAEWTWLKTTQMSRRQLLSAITILNRGFYNFALTAFSYSRRLEFSLRRPKNSGNRLSALDQALVELESGMKHAGFLYAPEQRDLYRVVQEIESAIQGIQDLAEEVRDFTKSARKMWGSFCEKNNGKLGRRFYRSPEFDLVREISFSFVIEPQTLFGITAKLQSTAEVNELEAKATEYRLRTMGLTPLNASQKNRSENVGAIIRSRSRRLTQGQQIRPEMEDIELCGTAIQLAFLYSEYIVSETKVTLEDLASLNKRLFRVHWQIPPLNAFSRITIWMLVSAECLFTTVQNTCVQEKDKSRLRAEFRHAFNQLEKVISVAERVGEKFRSMSQNIENLIAQVFRGGRGERLAQTKDSVEDDDESLDEVAQAQQQTAAVTQPEGPSITPEASQPEDRTLLETPATEDVKDSSPLDSLEPESEASEPEAEAVKSPAVPPIFDDPLLILADSGLLIDISQQLYNFANLPPSVQMKVFQMILQHIAELLSTASVTYGEALRLAGDSSVPTTLETKDDDSIGKLIEEMQMLFKGFHTVNNLELLVAVKSLRNLKDSLMGLRKEIGFINNLQRNALTRQLEDIQNVYDRVVFSRKNTTNSYLYSIAHQISGQLVFPIQDKAFERELDRVLHVPLDALPSLPAKFRRFATASHVSSKLGESIRLLDKTVQGFHDLVSLTTQPQPLLPVPESYPSLTLDEPASLLDAYSIFLAYGLDELNFRPVKYMTTLYKKVTGLEKTLLTCIERQKRAAQHFENSVESDLHKFRKAVDPLLERQCPEPVDPVGVNVELKAGSGDTVVRWDPVRKMVVLGYVGYAKFTPFSHSSCSRQEWILLALVKLISDTVHEVMTRGRNYKANCTQVQKTLELIRNYVSSSYVSSDQLSQIQALKIRLEGTKDSLVLLQQRLVSLKGKLKMSIEYIKYELAKASCKRMTKVGDLDGNPAKSMFRQLPVPFQVVLWNTEPQK